MAEIKQTVFLETFGHCKAAGRRWQAWRPGVAPGALQSDVFAASIAAHVVVRHHTVVVTPIARAHNWDTGEEHITRPLDSDFDVY